MSEHTPGSWEAKCYLEFGDIIIRADGKYVATVEETAHISHHKFMKADARLIVAAPRLLKACRWFVAQLDDHVLVRDISRDSEPDWPMRMLRFTSQLSEAIAAIAKAEGTEA